jgi:hypothetical protein
MFNTKSVAILDIVIGQIIYIIDNIVGNIL